MRILRGVVVGAILVTAAAIVPPAAAFAAVPANSGTYYPLAASRILDTRAGIGAPQASVGPGGTISLQVAGQGGTPATGMSAVVLNVTTTGATQASFLTVYPSGVTRPTASSLNFVAGWTGANSVTVAVGADGKVNIYNSQGNTQVIADVVGFYAADDSMVGQLGAGGQFFSIPPFRFFDTRTDAPGRLQANTFIRLGIDFGSDEANAHLRAMVVNVTTVGSSAGGYLAAWDGLGGVPGTSTLNYNRAEIVPNMAVVPVSNCEPCGDFPSIAVYTSATTDIIVDVVGVFDDGFFGDGMLFTPLTPTRIADTRIGQGAPSALGPGGIATITAPGSVAGADTFALAMNVTAVAPTSSTFLTVWPEGAGVDRPTSSSLNPAAGQTVPNSVYAEIGPTNAFNIYNSLGNTHVLVDVVGSFFLPTESAKSAPTKVYSQPRTLTGSQPAAVLHTNN